MKRDERRKFPYYGILPLILTLTANFIAYFGTRPFTSSWKHYNIETVLDQQIPVIPWTIVIYFGCYLVWIVNYLIAASREKEFVWAVLCSRCSGAACLYGILSAAADNERKAVDPGTGILESDACLALPDGCGGQFVPIDSLPEQLVLLYRSPQQTGDSALVSAVLFLGGTCRVCLYADNKAACDCRCDWRSASGRSDVADRGTHASWCMVWHDIGTKEVETPCRVRKK